MTDPTITDADREAAKEYTSADFEDEIAILSEIIARHRHAHAAPLEARVQELEEALGQFETYVKHRDLAARAAARASHRQGGTASWKREIDSQDRHLEKADRIAARIREISGLRS